ncbi:hypothetical protein HeN100_09690 [Escherichia coli]|nr:hypothetical protein [Escherichia coli]UZX07436.1 hypothetical protein HeN100_09690 [Escherichia coli]
MFAGKKSAQIREILINESAWEEMTCLFAPSLIKSKKGYLIKNRKQLSGLALEMDPENKFSGMMQ